MMSKVTVAVTGAEQYNHDESSRYVTDMAGLLHDGLKAFSDNILDTHDIGKREEAAEERNYTL